MRGKKLLVTKHQQHKNKQTESTDPQRAYSLAGVLDIQTCIHLSINSLSVKCCCIHPQLRHSYILVEFNVLIQSTAVFLPCLFPEVNHMDHWPVNCWIWNTVRTHQYINGSKERYSQKWGARKASRLFPKYILKDEYWFGGDRIIHNSLKTNVPSALLLPQGSP